MTVEVEHIWKTFQIPHEKRTTFFENLMGMMRPNNYETFSVLKDISFQVEAGECVGIIGDNGSGKSTLLKIIANILRASKGTVRVKGKMTPFLELGVGFHPDMTARENIGVYGTIMGLTRREIDERIDDVIDFAGLSRFEDTKLKNLSSGMQVRLAFSTAIQTNPDVLLVDEVLAVGDMEFQQKCFDVFNRYRKEGVTILFVSHDLGAVRRFCDRTLLLGGGEQRAFGETGEILDRYVYGENEKSREGKDTAEKGAAPAEPKRWGDKNVSITDVKFLDKFNRESGRFSSFDTMTIRIFYSAPAIIRDPVFGIALYSEQDQYLYGTNTELKNIVIDKIEGDGHIDLLIETIPMLSGRFLLTVAVHPHEGKAYDWIDKQYSFEVLPKGRDAGIFEVPCKWVT
jgi:lipopolysaccharide transport system ATP-binding protein